jgi:hypothetical protein
MQIQSALNRDTKTANTHEQKLFGGSGMPISSAFILKVRANFLIKQPNAQSVEKNSFGTEKWNPRRVEVHCKRAEIISFTSRLEQLIRSKIMLFDKSFQRDI